jgi:hypothetical protein
MHPLIEIEIHAFVKELDLQVLQLDKMGAMLNILLASSKITRVLLFKINSRILGHEKLDVSLSYNSVVLHGMPPGGSWGALP